MADLTVLSLGAGVQSSTLLALAAARALPDGYDKVDAAIFADAGSETYAVYEWLNTVLVDIAQKGNIDLRIVKPERSLAQEMLDTSGRYTATAPLHVEGSGILPRHCTSNVKIKPIRREIRNMLGVSRGTGEEVDCLLGISTDEVHRVKPSDAEWVKNRYPLVDMGWDRQDCIDFMVDEGYGEPPRSACTFCPYRSDAEWREMQENDYASLQDAMDFDEAVRKKRFVDAEVFVHPSRLPLSQIDFKAGFRGSQMGNECSGFCGV